MYVTQSGNTTVFTPSPTLTVTAVNTSTITLSSASAGSNTFNLYFGSPAATYSAIGVPSGGISANLVNQIVKNEDDYIDKIGTFDSDVKFIAKYPGELGNSLRVSVCETTNAYSVQVNVVGNSVSFTIGSNTANVVATNTAHASFVASRFTAGDKIEVGNSSIGLQYLTVSSVTSAGPNVAFTFEDTYRLKDNYSANVLTRYWEFYNTVQTAPGQSPYVTSYGNTSANDELHVVVVDDGGKFTGIPGTILEVYKGLSRATDAKNNDGSINYYKEVINQNSNYIWYANDSDTAVDNTAIYVVSATGSNVASYQLKLGSDGYSEANSSVYSSVARAYDQFVSTEDIDISLVLQGKPIGGRTSVRGETVANYQLANYIIDNICSVRKDCIALISPDLEKVYQNHNNEATSLKNWRGALVESSYAVLDSGYKYMYDKYNDVYRWIPLNGDIAGLCVRTDNTNDAWWSPAGFNRGQIKNSVKLAYNPGKSDRDILFSNNINPVVTFPGQGTVLYGDKTLLSKPSSFDRINVRRLFIVLEKAISTASKYSLFEFNDAFTRAQFKNLVNPYLRNIKGRRGITDFVVVCDETNNTPAVIDANQFVGDIYIKPAKSINYIQLNFVAVGTGVQFSEVIGKF
jgi:hypothetical protein